jgi:hypothetical protein
MRHPSSRQRRRTRSPGSRRSPTPWSDMPSPRRPRHAMRQPPGGWGGPRPDRAAHPRAGCLLCHHRPRHLALTGQGPAVGRGREAAESRTSRLGSLCGAQWRVAPSRFGKRSGHPDSTSASMLRAVQRLPHLIPDATSADLAARARNRQLTIPGHFSASVRVDDVEAIGQDHYLLRSAGRTAARPRRC